MEKITKEKSIYLICSPDTLGYTLQGLELNTMKPTTMIYISATRYAIEVIDNKALICGGISTGTDYSTTRSMIWHIDEGLLSDFSPLNRPRHNHSLLLQPNKAVYAIGGNVVAPPVPELFQKNCEMLPLQATAWQPLPSLNTLSMTAAVLDGESLYAMSASNVEYLDLCNLEEGWRMFHIGSCCLLPMCKALMVSEKQVLVFGMNGIDHLFDITTWRGEGRLSPVHIPQYSNVKKYPRVNGYFVFDINQQLWLFHCLYNQSSSRSRLIFFPGNDMLFWLTSIHRRLYSAL